MIVVSNQAPASPKPNSDWVDFHWQIKKCGNDTSRVDEVRTILQQHTEAPTLTTSTDGSQRTPLHLAAQRGNVQLGRILLDFGADINAKDSEPATVLDLAVINRNREFVAFLLDEGVDETLILDQNKDKFNEMKRIIAFSQNAAKVSPTKESRKTSFGTRRRLVSW